MRYIVDKKDRLWYKFRVVCEVFCDYDY